MTTAEYFHPRNSAGLPNKGRPCPAVSDDRNGFGSIRVARLHDGEPGGVFFKRSGEKTWRRFEATPDGRTFRVTPDDIRRAVADIERAKQMKDKQEKK